MEKNGSQYPKVGNKLQTITSEARHKQHNKLFEIFALVLQSKNQTLECAVGRPLKELLHALKTEGLCQSLYLAQQKKKDNALLGIALCFLPSRWVLMMSSDHSGASTNTVSDLEIALKETYLC